MRFVDITTIENTLTELIPILFGRCQDGAGDFAYLGGEHGRGKLESALAQPQQSFGGEYLYPTLADKTAALIWSIINNHAFVDGNKRTALIAANLFLIMNGSVLLATQADIVHFCRRVAGYGDDIDMAEVAEWIDQRIVRVYDPDLIVRAGNLVKEAYAEIPEDAKARLQLLNDRVQGH